MSGQASMPYVVRLSAVEVLIFWYLFVTLLYRLHALLLLLLRFVMCLQFLLTLLFLVLVLLYCPIYKDLNFYAFLSLFFWCVFVLNPAIFKDFNNIYFICIAQSLMRCLFLGFQLLKVLILQNFSGFDNL